MWPAPAEGVQVSKFAASDEHTSAAAHDPKAIRHAVDAVAELMPTYRRALEDGVSTVLRGRPVRPAIRPRG